MHGPCNHGVPDRSAKHSHPKCDITDRDLIVFGPWLFPRSSATPPPGHQLFVYRLVTGDTTLRRITRAGPLGEPARLHDVGEEASGPLVERVAEHLRRRPGLQHPPA